MITSYSPESGVVAPDANKDPSSGITSEDDDEPGMHRTDSTDFGVVLSGNLICELDDGAEVLLSPGDVVVQNGTRHRWRVVGDLPAVMAVVIIGAHRV
jgi:quercetin dioxygenase-like cupin family protein